MTRVYIAHHIHMRYQIRDKFCPNIQALGIETLNPFYNIDGSFREDRSEIKLIDEGKMEEYGIRSSELSKDIVDRDLESIRSCDGLVAYIEAASIGCSMEIFYCARVCKKPVFVLTNEKYSKHPWLVYLTSISGGFITTSEEELFKKLSEWGKSDKNV